MSILAAMMLGLASAGVEQGRVSDCRIPRGRGGRSVFIDEAVPRASVRTRACACGKCGGPVAGPRAIAVRGVVMCDRCALPS